MTQARRMAGSFRLTLRRLPLPAKARAMSRRGWMRSSPLRRRVSYRSADLM
ncbi:MAG: hypothetical protein MJE68_04910 [Proteobacteria bacterium]|nr:hypothetical protein [Pseudomonadota bacterium]